MGSLLFNMFSALFPQTQRAAKREGRDRWRFFGNKSRVEKMMTHIQPQISLSWSRYFGCSKPRSENKSIVPIGRNSSEAHPSFMVIWPQGNRNSFLSPRVMPWSTTEIDDFRCLSHPPLEDEWQLLDQSYAPDRLNRFWMISSFLCWKRIIWIPTRHKIKFVTKDFIRASHNSVSSMRLIMRLLNPQAWVTGMTQSSFWSVSFCPEMLMGGWGETVHPVFDLHAVITYKHAYRVMNEQTCMLPRPDPTLCKAHSVRLTHKEQECRIFTDDVINSVPCW